MVDAYEQVGGNVVAMLEGAARARPTNTESSRPGARDGRLTEITRPGREAGARGRRLRNLMLPGRYILQPEIMRVLGKIRRRAPAARSS